jgi:flagellar biosynthesis protein FliR
MQILGRLLSMVGTMLLLSLLLHFYLIDELCQNLIFLKDFAKNGTIYRNL